MFYPSNASEAREDNEPSAAPASCGCPCKCILQKSRGFRARIKLQKSKNFRAARANLKPYDRMSENRMNTAVLAKIRI